MRMARKRAVIVKKANQFAHTPLLKHNTSSESCHSSSPGPSPSPSLFSFSSSSLSPPRPPPRPFFGDLVAPFVHIHVWLFAVFLGVAKSPSLALDHHVRPWTRISLRIDRPKRLVGRYRYWTIHRFNVRAHATMRIGRIDNIIGDGHTCTSEQSTRQHPPGRGRQLRTKQSYRVSFLK